MKRARRIGRAFLGPSAVTGAFLGAAIVAAQPGGSGLAGLVLGWLYGVVVGGLMRLFRVRPGAYPLAGFLAGPVPVALLTFPDASPDMRGVVWLGFVVGLVLGCVEWAHSRCLEKPPVTEGVGAALGREP